MHAFVDPVAKLKYEAVLLSVTVMGYPATVDRSRTELKMLCEHWTLFFLISVYLVNSIAEHATVTKLKVLVFDFLLQLPQHHHNSNGIVM